MQVMQFLLAMVLGLSLAQYGHSKILEKELNGLSYDMVASVTYNASTASFSIVKGRVPDAVAWANFTETVNKTGWAHLTVTTNGSYPDAIQAYAAGVVEGHASAPFIFMNWMNTINEYCESMTTFCQKLHDFLVKNLEWMQTQIDLKPDDPYFHQLNLLLLQLSGLEDGYNGRADQPRIDLNPFGFLLFQIGGDLEDLESALNKEGKESMMGDGHCSALIRLLPGNADLFSSHDTWNGYMGMLRIIKKYNFAFHLTNTSAEVVPGQTAAFTSNPGSLLSGDDFYITNSGLVTIETTIGNNNNALWKYVQPTGQTLEWARNIIANRLARNGSHWAQIFSMYNSGTYNNQWMIVDYNKFTPGQTPSDGLLVVLEQIPGTIHSEDMTYFLREHSYWPSYNTPFFQDIYDKSGWPALKKKYGDWFSYNKTARANIFRRNQTQVTDLDSMIKLMRYNNFEHDPLSACDCNPPYSAENAIAARSDLNPKNGKYPFSALGHRLHGATDMKVTTSSMVKELSMVAVCGPTTDQQPPFQWSKSDFNQTLHLGQPDLFDFKPITVKWTD
ncbi:putative phospholipase B-like 2 [Diadema antillarum]|uniref:putative phospholipase B-like 2 n=1 Tax=Diadema antillarum TaxID=105358 RepID=UPI003A8BDEC4